MAGYEKQGLSKWTLSDGSIANFLEVDKGNNWRIKLVASLATPATRYLAGGAGDIIRAPTGHSLYVPP